MAYNGVEGDQRIFYSIFDGNHWSGVQPIAGANTNTVPALEYYLFISGI
jgi:hypothetical protein